jgi:hypothetical protein
VKHRCADFRDLIGDFSDLGTLSADGRRMFDDHLAECADCLASLKGAVVQRSVLRSVFAESSEPPPLSEALVRRCVAAMKDAAQGQRPESGSRTG